MASLTYAIRRNVWVSDLVSSSAEYSIILAWQIRTAVRQAALLRGAHQVLSIHLPASALIARVAASVPVSAMPRNVTSLARVFLRTVGLSTAVTRTPRSATAAVLLHHRAYHPSDLPPKVPSIAATAVAMTSSWTPSHARSRRIAIGWGTKGVANKFRVVFPSSVTAVRAGTRGTRILMECPWPS